MRKPSFSLSRPASAPPAQPNELAMQSVGGNDISEENLRERRYLWTARAFAIVCAISFCTNIILVMALFSLVPLTRVQPFYLTFENKDSQIVRITSMLPSPDVLNNLAESLVRQYIVMRHAVVSDVDEMMHRWGDNGPIKWMSSTGVFSEFNRQTAESFSRIRADRLTRDVNILSAYKLKTDPVEGDIWEAEVEMLEMLPERAEPVKSIWTVRTQIAFERKPEKWAYRLKNPIGFTVKRYSITPKGSLSTTGE